MIGPVLGGYLTECCWLEDPRAEVGAEALYNDYDAWAVRSKEKALSMKRFKAALTERGITQVQKKTGKTWLGLRLRTPTDPEPGPAGDGTGPVMAGDGFSEKSPREAHVEKITQKPVTTRHPSPDLPEDQTSDCYDPEPEEPEQMMPW